MGACLTKNDTAKAEQDDLLQIPSAVRRLFFQHAASLKYTGGKYRTRLLGHVRLVTLLFNGFIGRGRR